VNRFKRSIEARLESDHFASTLCVDVQVCARCQSLVERGAGSRHGTALLFTIGKQLSGLYLGKGERRIPYGQKTRKRFRTADLRRCNVDEGSSMGTGSGVRERAGQSGVAAAGRVSGCRE
jgi:hypothetical protein